MFEANYKKSTWVQTIYHVIILHKYITSGLCNALNNTLHLQYYIVCTHDDLLVLLNVRLWKVRPCSYIRNMFCKRKRSLHKKRSKILNTRCFVHIQMNYFELQEMSLQETFFNLQNIPKNIPTALKNKTPLWPENRKRYLCKTQKNNEISTTIWTSINSKGKLEQLFFGTIDKY